MSAPTRRSAHAAALLAEIDDSEYHDSGDIASLLQCAVISGSMHEDGDLSRMAAGYIAAGLIADPREHLA